MAAAIECHYEVLGVPFDADSTTIKKAHRKLALQYHPDKRNDDDSSERFLRIQQAYECLSDDRERKWYDDHRSAILQGWTVCVGNNQAGDGTPFLFVVAPFLHASCYRGNGDDENGFYAVYGRVFAALYKEERDGRAFQIDLSAELDTLLQDFGNAHSEWPIVLAFYQTWESFSSGLNFAWCDTYDVADAADRRTRRAMEDENRRARKTGKRERNEEILALVHFVKRRDPRVAARRTEVANEKLRQEAQAKADREMRKRETAMAREQWKEKAAQEMAALEEEDRLQGRIRLADLDDDYDYGGKKGKRRNTPSSGEEKKSTDTAREGDNEDNGDSNDNEPETGRIDEFSSSDESTEPDVWRCDCCRKDFKSQGQMDNHLQSKKHKAAMKKYQAKASS